MDKLFIPLFCFCICKSTVHKLVSQRCAIGNEDKAPYLQYFTRSPQVHLRVKLTLFCTFFPNL